MFQSLSGGPDIPRIRQKRAETGNQSAMAGGRSVQTLTDHRSPAIAPTKINRYSSSLTLPAISLVERDRRYGYVTLIPFTIGALPAGVRAEFGIGSLRQIRLAALCTQDNV
jgi:hypothetical protein